MRASGILFPIFSLPSPYGIGTLGKEAYRFVDFLSKAGQRYWQILPIGPTGFGDSPYQSFSAYAGNPYYIDLDMLKEDGLLKEEEYKNIEWFERNSKVDYEKLYNNRFNVLKIAYSRFKTNIPEDYEVVCSECMNWLEDYSLYMAIKDSVGGKCWCDWDEPLKNREPDALGKAKIELKDQIDFYKFINYKFTKQWFALKKYANLKDIYIIGDMPIYVSFDSADVWANPKQFLLDGDLKPVAVAGCPPDAFSKEGQLWGNPLYDWEYMKNSTPKYNWWCSRIANSIDMFDMIRIDHFRGFESYCSIPYGDKNAINGKWVKGPDIDLFNHFKEVFGELPIIAEDLGVITEDVEKLLEKTGFPGMKVLQFAFDLDSESSYLPHNHIKNCVVYTGTHDNDTVLGWERTEKIGVIEYAKKYMAQGDNEAFNWAVIRTALSSVADTVIIPFQDYIGAGSEARINTPSTATDNWQWRVDGGCINDWLAGIINKLNKVYHR